MKYWLFTTEINRPPGELTILSMTGSHFFGDGLLYAAMGGNGDICWGIWIVHIPAPGCWISVSPWRRKHGEAADAAASEGGQQDQFVYWQVTRGVEERNHTYSEGLPGKLWVYICPKGFADPGKSIRLNDREDTRFFHCNVKSLNLLPSVMAAQSAKRGGCGETIFHRGEIVTECAHSNVSVLKDGILYSHPKMSHLRGHRQRPYDPGLLPSLGISAGKPFSLDSLKRDEILVTYTTKLLVGQVN